ncbi:MAG: TIR domain-containing protein [Microcoleus sp. CSU_2_2]|nr:TIR domain-containing protein [Microcoleus sp. SU_5_3]NJS12802.1 TIR domain-containing protein [Microcoleus sp. CSU_2_2]
MNCEEALEFLENLVYTKNGKHLSDLEREVFIGSWEGKTYEQIYPLNPEYIEKDVGFKLWRKLSIVLGDKVTKKKVRGAIDRAARQGLLKTEPGNEPRRVFISYCRQEPDSSLAVELTEGIKAAGHQVFTANIGPVCLDQNSDKHWLSEIDTQLEQCEYFLLLLSGPTAVSEIVIEELRRIKELRYRRQKPEPIVLPIRVNYPASIPLNHDLRNYINERRQREWESPSDTAQLLQEIHQMLSKKVMTEGTQQSGLATVIDTEEDISGGFIVNLNLLPQENIFPQCTATTVTISRTLPLSNPPSPAAEPELPQGQVRLDSAFYVHRVPWETQCYKEILQPGTLIRIKAPRQMGKTSLMARILYQAKEKGCRTVPLSFQHADAAAFTNLNELLRWFCTKITRKLRLSHQIDDYWTDTYGSKDNCTAYFEDCLLPENNAPLVLGLDEVDRVFQYPKIADDFFGLLRAWYEEAGYGDSDSELWAKLRLVVVHSTEVYIPLNVNQSPFNVGLPIELSEFSAEQVADLARRHGLNWHRNLVDKLMKIVGGHPYLVRVALYHIARKIADSFQTVSDLAQESKDLEGSLDELLELAPTEAGVYGDHLRRHLWNLQEHRELGVAFSRVVTANEPVELESVLAFKLHSLGLVQLRGNEVNVRFELYRQYFSDRLKSI